MIQVGDKVKVVNNNDFNYSKYKVGDTFVVKGITNSNYVDKWLHDTPKDEGNGISIKNVKLIDMKEFTVEVKDKALSKALQEVAFENGWEFIIRLVVKVEYQKNT